VVFASRALSYHEVHHAKAPAPFRDRCKAAARIEQELDGIDIVFANAGVQGFKALLEMDNSDWQVQIDNNLTGTAKVIRAFAPHLVKRKGGPIIVTSSTQYGSP